MLCTLAALLKQPPKIAEAQALLGACAVAIIACTSGSARVRALTLTLTPGGALEGQRGAQTFSHTKVCEPL